ncbi:MAG: ROK family protein [Oculatellaceae cyanobacterium bins.114]|nr:ROK family protein [Oculatellaceae cyanobacterium bins.114]
MYPEGATGQFVVGIDLGGTAIKLGRFDRTGQCLQSLSVPTPQPSEPEAVLAAMVAAIAQLDPDNQSLAIGVGTPGPADVTGRIARVAINLGWKDVPLADWLEAKTGKPTLLANDANCAGLGEYWLGAGRRFENLILLTLGTGVGGAIILNGKLFTGRDGTAGELGLITLDYAGPSCNSGNDGSLEQHVSVQAIRRRTGLEPEVLGTKAKAGDAEAIAFWQTYGCELGAGLASLIYVLTPEAVLIGGGVSASAEFFFSSMQAEIERRVLPSSRDGLQLLTAELGNHAGIVGAAKLAWQIVDDHSSVSPQTNSVDQSQSVNQLQQTQLAYVMASEISQFKAGFLARTSHELRSPLNSVISLHQLILADLCDSPEEERDFIAQAHTAAQKMLRLLDEVIRVSKTEYGTEQFQLQPLQLAMILEEVQRLTQLQAQNRSLRLEVELPHPDLYVSSDPRWLHQILLSLIDTPLSLMQEGTVRVTTQVSPEGDRVLIQIEDERPPHHWSEPIHLLQSPRSPESTPFAHLKEAIATATNKPTPIRFSPEFMLLINQTLLELMGGQLELLAIPTDAATEATVTCIQCSVPLVVQENES